MSTDHLHQRARREELAGQVRDALVTVGQLVAVAAGTIAVAVAIIDAAVLRPRRAINWRMGPAAAAGIGPMVVPQLTWTHPAIQVRGWPILAVGPLLLAFAWWPRASARIIADRILDPRTGKEPFHTPRLAIATIRWSLPVILLCAAVPTILLPDSSR